VEKYLASSHCLFVCFFLLILLFDMGRIIPNNVIIYIVFFVDKNNTKLQKSLFDILKFLLRVKHII